MRHILQILTFLVVPSIPLLAQTAEMTGRVTDPSGAVIIAAAVTATNEATQVERRTNTTDAGYYTLTQLPPGDYRLRVEASGFSPQVQTGIHLAVQQSARIDVQLKVGAVSESVEVAASTALLETSNAAVGFVIENKRVVDLPLKGRQFLEFALLGAGVNGGRSGDVRSSQQGIAISANGLYTKSNNFMLDGADNNESYQNQFAISPSVDAVEEFKVQTGLYPAEYGRGGGAVVSIVTKSGTNQFHGVLFEFLRNDAFDARNFFAQSKTPLRRNQFGGTLGGPIRKNQTFFFASYDGTRQRRRSVSNPIVPTEAQRGGDLSSFTTPVKDPYAGGTPFPGNIIPTARITSVAKNLLAYYPLPNMPAGSRNNYYSTFAAKSDPNLSIFKIDHRFSDRDSIYGRYAYNQGETFSPGSVPLAGGTRATDGAHGATVNWTHLFSPTRLNTAAVSYNRFIQDAVGQNNGTPVAANAGIIGVSSNPRDVGFPESLGFSAGTGFLTLGEASVRLRRMNTYQIQDTFSITHGSHYIKFGGEFRALQANVVQTSGLQGSFTFNGQYTGGNGFAEYLLGIPSATQVSLNAGMVYPRRKAYALFLQDEWKALPTLTVSAGLRYELNMPATDARGKLSAFDHSTGEIVFPSNADLGDFFTAMRPDMKYRQLSTKSLYNVSARNFGPRLGLAWRPGNSKTVFRVGSGFFFLSPELNSEQNTGNSPPFQLRLDAVGNAGTPNLSWNLGGDTSYLKSATFGIFTMNADRQFRNGRVMEWMAEVQRELSPTLMMRVGYVGNKGVGLDTHLVRNQLPPGPGAANTRRIFPAYARIRTYESDGWSTYHGLQSTIEKRLGHGLTAMGTYTWAKTMDFGWTQDICCQQDINNLAAEKALASHDQRQRVTANAIYELPFGKGKRFGSTAPGWADKLMEGWRVGTSMTFATGMPSNPSVSGNPDNVPDNTDRPNRIGSGKVDNPTIDRWWDATAFVKQSAYMFGNSGRNVLTAPGVATANLVTSKNTRIKESMRLEFRAEFFNFTNTPNFSAPSTTDVTNPNFGKIFGASAPREMQFGLKFYY